MHYELSVPLLCVLVYILFHSLLTTGAWRGLLCRMRVYYLFALQTDSWRCGYEPSRSELAAAGGSPYCFPMVSMEDGAGLNTHVTFEV